jgi:hypothetical protein
VIRIFDQRKLHTVSDDFIGTLRSRVAARADRETVSGDGVRLSGYEFLGLVEYAAEVMGHDLGVSAGDVVGIRTFHSPVGLATENITHMFMVEPALGKFVADLHRDRPGTSEVGAVTSTAAR